MINYLITALIVFIAGAAHAQKSSVDFKRVQAEIEIAPEKGEVSGDLSFSFDVLAPTDSIFIDARGMTFNQVRLDGQEVSFYNDGERIWIISDFKESREHMLEFSYAATPKQAMYFIPTAPKEEPADFQVWTQGQGKSTSHWLPSFDRMDEKLEFDLSFIYPKGNTVISNGVLLDSGAVGDNSVRWKFDMEHPMSSYLVAIAAGDFERVESRSRSGVPMKFYFPKEKRHMVEPTYRFSEEIMDFLEQEIGVPFPWQEYDQVPVRDFLYAGMENTGTTLFSDMFLVDSVGFADRKYTMVNAHELAHQWFGNLVTAASEKHHWLQEGFATYYALLAEKELFGEDYFYWKLYQSAEELKKESDLGKGQSLLGEGGSSLTYYQKGAWALHVLKNIVGKKAFDAGVRDYLLTHAFSNVTTTDFLSAMERASGKDLSEFREDWLEQSAFQGTRALEELEKSPFIRAYLQIASLKPLPIESKKELLEKALDFPVNNYIGQEVIHQLSLEKPSTVLPLYKKAFDSGNLYVRQAIAMTLSRIPDALKSRYESLLEDASYATQEAALFNLWVNFPQDRQKYLKRMEGREGFMDKNIRTLWLALKVATRPGAAKNEAYLATLSSFTAPHHRFQVRQHAFEYLYQLRAFSSKNIYDLLQASRHPNYRFRTFAKRLLKKVLELENLLPEDRKLLEQELKRREN